MLQSLISLEDNEIDTVLNAVTAYCGSRGVSIESEEGRKAIAVAVDVISSRHAADLFLEIQERLDESRKRCA